jgi:hypothetical protein
MHLNLERHFSSTQISSLARLTLWCAFNCNGYLVLLHALLDRILLYQSSYRLCLITLVFLTFKKKRISRVLSLAQTREGAQLIPRIGQFLVELHVHFGYVQEKYPNYDAFTFATECEKHGFRVFNQEVNKLQTIRFTELGLIHHNWIRWDAMKSKLQ